jgi:hypothetical protein
VSPAPSPPLPPHPPMSSPPNPSWYYPCFVAVAPSSDDASSSPLPPRRRRRQQRRRRPPRAWRRQSGIHGAVAGVLTLHRGGLFFLPACHPGLSHSAAPCTRIVTPNASLGTSASSSSLLVVRRRRAHRFRLPPLRQRGGLLFLPSSVTGWSGTDNPWCRRRAIVPAQHEWVSG